MNSLADTLWTVVRWAVPLTVAAVLSAVAIGTNRLGEEVRVRAEARLAAEFPDLVAQVQGASIVAGEGLVLRGVSLTDPRMPQQWRQMVWIDEVRLACDTSLPELAGGTPRFQSVRVRRPVVHAVHHADGTWNLARLRRGVGGGEALPVTVEDGTLLVDDLRLEARTTLRRVQVEIAPGSAGALAVRGSVEGDLFERAGIQGTFVPASKSFDLRGTVESIDVSPRLLRMIAAEASDLGADSSAEWVRQWGGGVRGRVDLGGRVAGRLDDLSAAEAAVTARVEAGRFEHASLPFPFRDVSARLAADRQGVRCESFEAHTGSSMLRGSGTLAGWSPSADFQAVVEAERLVVDRNVEGLLPDSWKVQWSRLLPAGEVDFRAQLVRRSGVLDPKVSVRCRNASLTHYRFPYRVDRTVGTVAIDGGSLAIHLTGQAGGRPVHIEGNFRSTGAGSVGALEVRGEGMRVDDAIVAAMPARTQAIVRSLRAGGVFDFVYRHERSAGLPAGASNSLGIRLVDCSMNYGGFPYPLTKVRGSLRMQDGTWTIRDIVGVNDTGTVRCNGALVPRGADDGDLSLDLVGEGVMIERELRDALPRGARDVWDDLDPRGTVDFRAAVRHAIKSRSTSVEVRATPHGDTVSIEPAWFPCRMEQLKGALEWKDGLLSFAGVRGRSARTTVAADGSCRFLPDGGWHVSFSRLALDRFRAENEVVLGAMPEGVRRAIAAVHPRGTLSLDGALDVYSAPAAAGGRPGRAVASWDVRLDMEQVALDVGTPLEHVHGGARLRGHSDGAGWRCDGDLRIDSAVWHGMQVTGVEGPLAFDPSGARFGASAARPGEGDPRRLLARLAGGTLALDGAVAAGDAGGFTLAASLVDADLERITTDTGRSVPGGKPFRGRVFGGLELTGSRAGSHSLAGRGQVRLRDADLYELPVVLAMLKVLRVKAPDLRAFGSSVIDFRVEGPRAYLDNIELSGDAISLVGSGEIGADSAVHLTFRSIMGDSQTQLPAMKSMLGGASGNFLLIHVDGTLADPDITSEAFPTLAAALQKWQEQTRKRDVPVPPPPSAMAPPAGGAAAGVRTVGHLEPVPPPARRAPDPAAPASGSGAVPNGAGGYSGGPPPAASVGQGGP